MHLYQNQTVKIYNSLSGEKELFKPIHEGAVGMYVCGPTVYSNVHLGNCRTFISFDMVFRYLKHLGYKVRYVRNITDIDDKIIRRAVERKQLMSQVTDFYIAAMHADEKALGVQSPDSEPRATQQASNVLMVDGQRSQTGDPLMVGGPQLGRQDPRHLLLAVGGHVPEQQRPRMWRQALDQVRHAVGAELLAEAAVHLGIRLGQQRGGDGVLVQHAEELRKGLVEVGPGRPRPGRRRSPRALRNSP